MYDQARNGCGLEIHAGQVMKPCVCVCVLRGCSKWRLMWFTWTAMMPLTLTSCCQEDVIRRERKIESQKAHTAVSLPASEPHNWSEVQEMECDSVRKGIGRVFSIYRDRFCSNICVCCCWVLSSCTFLITGVFSVVAILCFGLEKGLI